MKTETINKLFSIYLLNDFNGKPFLFDNYTVVNSVESSIFIPSKFTDAEYIRHNWSFVKIDQIRHYLEISEKKLKETSLKEVSKTIENKTDSINFNNIIVKKKHIINLINVMNILQIDKIKTGKSVFEYTSKLKYPCLHCRINDIIILIAGH